MSYLERKIPPVVVVAVIASAMLGLSRLMPSAAFELRGSGIASLVFVAMGAALVMAGIFVFRANKTTVDPRTPDAASTVVVGGVYRFSRNPMYLGFLLILAGLAIYLSNAIAVILLPVFVAYITKFQIRAEERMLLSKFGARYAEYMTSVRRWL